MKKSHIMLAAVSVAALSSVSHAAITAVNTAQDAAWVGTPSYQTGAGPTTDSGGTNNDNDGWGQSGSGVAGNGSLAQAFVVSSAGTLQNFQVVFTGAAETFDVSLYDLGPASSFNSGAGFPSVPAQLNFVPTSSSQSSVDLLSAGDQFVFYGNSGDSLYTLSPSETVNLSANEVYALALDPTGTANVSGSTVSQSPSNTWWVRGGLPSASYSNGEGFNTDSATYAYAYQNFEGHSGPYSSGGRNFDTAVVVATPEPASLSLAAFVVAAGLVRRRSHRAGE